MKKFRLLLPLWLMLALACSGSSKSGDTPDASVDEDLESLDSVSGRSACKSAKDCPEGFCSPISGECVQCTNDSHCEDGEKCLSGQCFAGVACTPGEYACNAGGEAIMCNDVGTGYKQPQSCDDGIECTVDSCVEGAGCSHASNNGVCDDHNVCTEDLCTAEGCTHGVSEECGEGGVMDLSPASLSFPPTVPGEQWTQKNVLMSNVGLGSLKVYEAEILDEFGIFKVLVTATEQKDRVEFFPPLEIEPGKAASLTLAFVPDQLGDFEATLRVVTNDSTKPEGKATVKLLGKAVASNCIKAIPEEVDFGPRVVGVKYTKDIVVENCGDGLVPIYDLLFQDGGSPEIAIDAALTAPYNLDVGQSTTITVAYTPAVPETTASATLIVENGAPMMPKLPIPVSGVAMAGDAECPIAVITYDGKVKSLPFEALEFSGADSYGLGADVATYQWNIDEPPGSHVSFAPTNKAPQVSFAPLVGGEYLVKLSVWDEEGAIGCNVASHKVSILPEDNIYVELVWTTPGDADESDEGVGKGADLDLHFASPFASGLDVNGDGEPDGWFDTPNDCYWGEPDPEWGSFDPQAGDDPSLAREDVDGAGPEVITMNNPADGTYKVGVHYFSDHDFGPSMAKITVYLNEGKVLSTEFVPLVSGDMWDVARIMVDGMSITISPKWAVGGTFDVTPQYEAPSFPD